MKSEDKCTALARASVVVVSVEANASCRVVHTYSLTSLLIPALWYFIELLHHACLPKNQRKNFFTERQTWRGRMHGKDVKAVQFHTLIWMHCFPRRLCARRRRCQHHSSSDSRLSRELRSHSEIGSVTVS